MINIEPSKSTPRVVLDNVNKHFIIEGQSYPENSSSFYEPVIRWIKDYSSIVDDEFILSLKLNYINSSSTKAVIYICDIMEDAYLKGRDCKINWICAKGDDMAVETGLELLEDYVLPYAIMEI